MFACLCVPRHALISQRDDKVCYSVDAMTLTAYKIFFIIIISGFEYDIHVRNVHSGLAVWNENLWTHPASVQACHR